MKKLVSMHENKNQNRDFERVLIDISLVSLDTNTIMWADLESSLAQKFLQIIKLSLGHFYTYL